MALPTAEEITNLYLYGTKNRPNDLLDPSILAQRNGASINVDVVEYMAIGAGRFVNAANFEVVNKFFNTPGLQPGSYTKTQLFQQFGIAYGGYTVQQLYLGTGDSDYAERTYIWGTTKFKIVDDAVFVVKPDGSREIQNFAIVPDSNGPNGVYDDFDFQGGPASNIGNAALEPVIDPSGIGKTVTLNFTGINTIPRTTLTAAGFANDKAKVITVGLLDELSKLNALYAIQNLTKTLFSSGSQPIRFLDADNRPIIYGSNSDDIMNGYVTPVGRVDLDQDEYNVGSFLFGSVLDFGLDSELYPYIGNGIAYVAGAGNDTITGTDQADILIGGAGQDTMNGGAGDDIFIIEGTDKDYDIFNGGEGTDTILGGDGDDTIRVHQFTGDNTVEIIDGGAGTDTIAGTDGGDSIDLSGTALRNIERIETGKGDDSVTLGADISISGDKLTIDGGDNNDILDGRKATVKLELIGGTGNDRLYGGTGDDTLKGGAGADRLEGGDGYDSYFVDTQDAIRDSDGEGSVTFFNTMLGHATRKKDDPEHMYRDVNGNVFLYDENTKSLIVSNTRPNTTGSLNIEDYTNGDLGIVLEDEPDRDPMEPIRDESEIASTYASPIILDLDGDGVETRLLAGGTYFDHDANGFAEQTGWVGQDDGLLARDLNGNGTIDSGRELFGSETLLANGKKAANGFEALKELDSNGDGVIDAKDSAFSTLRVWKDGNGNGRTDAGELLTLAEAGVRGINLAYTNSGSVDAQGNTHKQTGSYTTTAGQTRKVDDVWFAADPMYSIATKQVEVPADIAALPTARGYGNVRDLDQAMAMDATGQLKTLVTAFTQAGTDEERMMLVRQIIYRWTGVQDINPVSRTNSGWGNGIGDARKLEALEEFLGQEWVQGSSGWGPNPGADAARTLNEACDQLETLVYSQLMAGSHLKTLFEQITYSWDKETQSAEGDLSLAAQTITAQIAADRQTGLTMLGDFLVSLKSLGLLDRMDLDAFKADLPIGADVTQTFNTALANWKPSVVCNGTELDDVLYGTKKRYELYGFGGNDVLVSGPLDDYLMGEAGSDTYIFGRGNGHDTISEYSANSGETDRIQLKDGITPDDVHLERMMLVSDDLKLTIRDTGETVTVQNQFYGSAYGVEEIVFADGTVWDLEAIKSRVLLGEGGDDSLLGFDDRDDLIIGGAGNDTLQGLSGNDTLIGGTGNDELYGGRGGDTYIYQAGDGQTTIDDGHYALKSGGVSPPPVDDAPNILSFGAGIRSEDLSYSGVGGNLVITFANQPGDKVILRGYEPGRATQTRSVDIIRFADGTEIAVDSIEITDGTDEGGDTGKWLIGTEGIDILTGGNGDDTFEGRGGSDWLNGKAGSDTYLIYKELGSPAVETYILEIWREQDTNRIEFTGAVNADDLRLAFDGSDLLLRYTPEGDNIRFIGFSPLDPAPVQEISLPDAGIKLSFDELLARGVEDYENSFTSQTVGDDGDNVLTGQNVYNEFRGGKGNDTLNGGNRVDGYFFESGDGIDTIVDDSSDNFIVFGPGIGKSDLTTVWDGDTLILRYGTGDEIKIPNYLGKTSDGTPPVTAIRFDNGDMVSIPSLISDAKVVQWNVGALPDATEDAMYRYTIPLADFDQSGAFGKAYLINVQLADGNPLPTWLMFDAERGVLLATPTNDDVGQIKLNVEFWGKYELLATQQMTLVVNNVNDPPEIGVLLTDQQAKQDRAFTYTLPAGSFIDVDVDDVLTYTATLDNGDSLPHWLTFDAQTQTFSGTPADSDIGTLQLRVTATDLAGASVSQKFALSVLSVGDIDNRIFLGTDGDDTLYGTADNDTINGLGGNDQLYGLAGNDTMNGGGGSDTVYGGAGNDILKGGAGNDILYGGDGDDCLDGEMLPGYSYKIPDWYASVADRSGADTMYGGYGNDCYFVDNAGDKVVEYAGRGCDRVYASINYTLTANVEFLWLMGTENLNGIGNNLDNYMIGNEGNNFLNGGAGNDTLVGLGGNDTLWGGAGDDALSGGTGADFMAGGADNDWYSVDDPGDVVFERPNEGRDRVNASISYTLTANVEDLVLSGTANLKGTGNNLNNVIIGNSGNNFLSGRAGNDILRGGDGDDTLYGGSGNDTLTGGAGADTFVFASIFDGIDTITDFASCQDQMLITGQLAQNELKNLVAEMHANGGVLSAKRFVANNTGVATNASQRIIYDLKTGALYYDADGSGSGVATQFATLSNKPANLNADNFFAAAS